MIAVSGAFYVHRWKKRKNSGSRGGPGVNEVSFRTRPHHNVHSTLGVDPQVDVSMGRLFHSFAFNEALVTHQLS